ncbi:methyltransferase domain-containing protein [Kitasatospora xanthocidica]|uniref:methyltransferase domain-containing protein n=1 Tax=Kitasatospora xanthocidica TaxID=83382 RepID=UPI00216B0F19|nr:methyltransferase domain-containing protein [Kitasatospora xanthocidica]
MSESNEPVHTRLAELAAPYARSQVVDLGCGAGPTLRAVSKLAPEVSLVGIDRSEESLRRARIALTKHSGPTTEIVADLSDPLPCADASADVVLSYNTIECLPDPHRLLLEVARVLRPGGRAIMAHVDFDSMVVAGAGTDLDRRVCHAFADDVQGWMDHADGRMGRKLGMLLARSPLTLVSVEPLLAWSTEFSGHAKERIGQIRKALLSAARHGRASVDPAEVEAWFAAVCEADRLGGFFFSELAFIAVAERPSEEQLISEDTRPARDGRVSRRDGNQASGRSAAA